MGSEISESRGLVMGLRHELILLSLWLLKGLVGVWIIFGLVYWWVYFAQKFLRSLKAKDLKLETKLKRFWLQGSTLGVSMHVSTQRVNPKYEVLYVNTRTGEIEYPTYEFQPMEVKDS
jgi:uncharacterized membrane protein YciS (DUF1049 family)